MRSRMGLTAGHARWSAPATAFLPLTILLAAALGVPGPAAAQDLSSGAATVDSLLTRGRLQEAAWALRASGDTARADSVLERLAAILRSPPVSARPLGMDSQGVSYTWRLDHGQGIASIFKVDGSDVFCPECGADREVATYRLDRLLGFDVTPMTVRTSFVDEHGDTLRGSTMYFVNDAMTPAEAGAVKPDALHLFDAMVGNSDRHATNWLLAGGRVVAIDHNRSFEYQPTTSARTCWEPQVDSIADPSDLGPQWDRYVALAPDSVRAALAGLDPELADRFLSMRERIAARVRARALNPDTAAVLTDCGLD